MTKDARPVLLDLESLSQEELAKLQSGYQEVARNRRNSGDSQKASSGTGN